MTITLRPEHERLIARAMQTGAYQNPDDVIARALEMLHLEEEWMRDDHDLIHDKIERAFAQFESGDYLTAEQSRADMDKRKTRWIAERPY